MLPIIGPILDIINKLVPDANLAAQIEREITQQQSLQQSVIMKEANSENWITRNWRPCTMVVFVSMLIMYFVMYEVIPYMIVITNSNLFTPQNPGLDSQLVDVIKMGLSGYI
jgi:hypothetical protein